MEAVARPPHCDGMASKRGRPRQIIGKHRANRIELLRLREGLTQGQLGALCKPALTENKISRLERRIEPLTLDLIYQLADALGVHRVEIFEDLPYAPRVAAMADRVNALAEPDQEQVLRVVDATIGDADKAVPGFLPQSDKKALPDLS